MANQVKYNWSKLFSKSRFTMKHGKDFTCQVNSMVQQIRVASYNYGVQVSIGMKDPLTIKVEVK